MQFFIPFALKSCPLINSEHVLLSHFQVQQLCGHAQSRNSKEEAQAAQPKCLFQASVSVKITFPPVILRSLPGGKVTA